MAGSSNYGSIAPGSAPLANGSHAGDAAGQERAPLLGKPNDGGSMTRRFRSHMSSNVNRKWADIALLACYIITGLLDSSAVFIWGSFLSMQTGNTVYLGLGIVAPNENNRWIRSLISILCFCIGSFFFGAYHRYFGGRKRWVLVSSYILQLLLITASALMVTLGPKTGTGGPISVWIAVPIAMTAFQAAGQAITSRVMQYASLTSVVLTSIYCDLFSDPNFFAAPSANPERNRRAAAPVLLLIGAMIGGLWAHSEVGLAGALWTAVGLKFLATVAWMLWAAEKEEAD